MFYGRTLIKNEKGTYNVKKTMGRIVRQRNVPSERMSVFLNPQFHKMDFQDVKDLIDDTIRYFDEQTDINEISGRKAFLNGLKEIIDQYVAEEQPYKNAMEDFKVLVKLQAPEQYKDHIIPLLEGVFKWDNFNQNVLSRCKVKSKCFSKWMDNKASKEFWSKEHCFTDGIINVYGTSLLVIIRNIICKFFGED